MYNVLTYIMYQPFVRDSFPIATPRACISLLLKVLAVLIPLGKPVTFLAPRMPAGPSFIQREGIVTLRSETMKERFGGLTLPEQRPGNSSSVLAMSKRNTNAQVVRTVAQTETGGQSDLLLQGHLGDSLLSETDRFVPCS